MSHPWQGTGNRDRKSICRKPPAAGALQAVPWLDIKAFHGTGVRGRLRQRSICAQSNPRMLEPVPGSKSLVLVAHTLGTLRVITSLMVAAEATAAASGMPEPASAPAPAAVAVSQAEPTVTDKCLDQHRSEAACRCISATLLLEPHTSLPRHVADSRLQGMREKLFHIKQQAKLGGAEEQRRAIRHD